MAQGKVKSIAVEIFDKDSGKSEKAFMNMDLNAATAMKVGAKFGSVGITDVVLEDVTVGDNTIKSVKSFTIPEKSEDAQARMGFKAVNIGFKTQEGGDYNIKKVIALEAVEGQKGLVPKKDSSALLSDLGTVATAGFLSNKGKKVGDKDFFDGTTEVFQRTYYENPKKIGKDDQFSNEEKKGYEKRITIDKIDPREVKAAVADLTARAAERKAPEAEDGPGR